MLSFIKILGLFIIEISYKSHSLSNYHSYRFSLPYCSLLLPGNPVSYPSLLLFFFFSTTHQLPIFDFNRFIHLLGFLSRSFIFLTCDLMIIIPPLLSFTGKFYSYPFDPFILPVILFFLGSFRSWGFVGNLVSALLFFGWSFSLHVLGPVICLAVLSWISIEVAMFLSYWVYNFNCSLFVYERRVCMSYPFCYTILGTC